MKRLIKRYHNRKMYDTASSSYVTLEDIALLVKRGDELKIVDNSSKEDITGQTLAQVIYEEEKKKTSSLPLEILRKLIQAGGETIKGLVATEFTHVKSFVEEKIKPTLENVQNIPAVQQELKKLRERLDQLEKNSKKK